jgi:aminotransferase
MIADYLSRAGWVGGGPAADQVCVTVGSEEAIYLALKTVVDPMRDEVLIVEPCYLAYPKICMLEGIRHRFASLSAEDGFRPLAEAVLAELRPETRLIILNSPANPTGRIWPADELRSLAAGLSAREGREVFVLSDEVYRELYYGDEEPSTIAAHHPHSLVAGSLSKSNALTGLRLGWLAGPTAAIGSATKVHQFVNTAASTFSQRVAIAILAEPDGLAAHRPMYRNSRDVLLGVAAGHQIDLIPPEGAFYALVRLPPHQRSSLDAAERILDECRVVTVPGVGFGQAAEGWLRISWVAPVDYLREGLERIATWMRA